MSQFYFMKETAFN